MSDYQSALEDSFGYALHHSSFMFTTALKDAFKRAELDITKEEFVFLFTVPKEGEIQAVLTKKALKDKTTVTRMVDRLVAKELLERRENPDNRRQQLLFSTPAGEAMKKKLMPEVMKVMQKATAGIDPKKLQSAKETLRQITSNLTD